MRDAFSLIWLALIGLFRSRAPLQVEILRLRHQLNVLRRKSPQRLGFTSIDRLVFAGLWTSSSVCACLISDRHRLIEYCFAAAGSPHQIRALFVRRRVRAWHQTGSRRAFGDHGIKPALLGHSLAALRQGGGVPSISQEAQGTPHSISSATSPMAS